MMAIQKETREMFMSLPTWNSRDALRMLLEINPDSVSLDDDFDGTEIEFEARALIGWLYRFGFLPRAIREPNDAAPELVADYLEAIGEVRRTPAEWIAAATANPGAPAEWLQLLQPPSGASESDDAISENIPGKLPNVSTGRLAVKAAWEIELKTGRAASRDDVMSRLQEWATTGKHPETLIRAVKEKRAIEWHTKEGKGKIYDIEACGKTIEAWNKTRA